MATRQFVCYGSRIQCPHEDCDDFLAAAGVVGVRVRVNCENHGALPDLLIIHVKGRLQIKWENQK